MRDSNKRALVAPIVRAKLANPTDTGATKCLSRRMVLGLTLLAAAIAVPAMAFAVPQATTSSQSLKCIQYLIDRGQVDDAEKQLWEIITREPENVPAINLLGAIRTWQKRYPEAEALFKRVLAIQPDFVSANRSLGQLYALQARRDDPKAAYQKALELRPRDANAPLALAAPHEEPTARTLPRATKLDAHSFDALFQSSRLASQAKEYKKEADLLDKALEIQPDDLEALRHLVLALMRSGDAVKAVAAARQLYSLKPADPDTLYLLGAALANHAEWHDARPIMEKLVSRRDDATAHVRLGA